LQLDLDYRKGADRKVRAFFVWGVSVEVSGEVGFAEVQRACEPLARRLYGWKRFAGLLSLIAPLIGGLVLQAIIDSFFEGFGIFAFLIAMGVGVVLAIKAGKGVVLKSWSKRGVPERSTVNYQLLDDGILFETPLVATKVKWEGLTEIAPGRDAWLFIAQSNAHVLPKRVVATANVEAAFLAECLNRMTPEARARSVEAASLVAKSP